MKKLFLSLALGLGLTLTPAVNAKPGQACNACGPKEQTCDGPACSEGKKPAGRNCPCQQEDGQGPWQGPMDHTRFYLKHAEALNLTEVQIKTLEEQQAEFQKNNQALHQEWQKLHAGFSQKIHDKDLSEKEIKKHAKEVGALKTKMIELRLLHQHASAKVLNNEQNQQVWNLLKDQQDSSSKQHKRGKKLKKNKRNKKNNDQ